MKTASRSEPDGESSRREWLLNGGGWLLGALLGPALVAGATARAMRAIWPQGAGSLWLPSALAFGASFLALDYVSYWVHRLMHRAPFWRLHFVHHTVVRLNGIAAGRHSFGEGVLNPLLLVHGVVLFLLADNTWYAIGTSTTFVLEIWRHSSMTTHASNPVARVLHDLLVTPEAHAVHHRAGAQVNFGTNLKIWDRLHRTYQAPDARPATMGEVTSDGILRLLLLGARRPGESSLAGAK